MDQSYAHCSLFLCPEQHDYHVDDITDLISKLRDFDFLADMISGKQTAFLTGEKFLNHIAYMGCAPSIQFEPTGGDDDNDDENYCHIKLHRFDEARVIHNKSHCRAPHCPRCNKPIDDWRDQISATRLYCHQCETHSAIETIQWRKIAGYAHLFIEITDVFPKEAIPQTSLLDSLKDMTGTDWTYFYSCQ